MKVDSKSILFLVADRFRLKRATLEDRLKLQKTVYLLQIHGLQLGYGFGWYKYGPYSQDLVHEAYTVLSAERSLYEHDTKNWDLSEESKDKFNEFTDKLDSDLHDPVQLELLASAHFVHETWCDDDTSDEVFVATFKKRKRRLFGQSEDLTKEQILAAWNKCKTLIVMQQIFQILKYK